MLSAVWLFGIPGTTPLTGPKGTQPSFKFFTINDAAASTYDSVRDFQGGAGNGWEPDPEGEVTQGSPEATLNADLDTPRQRPSKTSSRSPTTRSRTPTRSSTSSTWTPRPTT